MSTSDKSDIELAGCLRRLLKNRFIIRRSNEKWFQAIIEHRQAIQSIFQKRYFCLEINETIGVIYLRPESEEIEERIGFQMHKKKSLSMFSSILALHLRKERLRFYMNPGSSEIPLISNLNLREFLQTFNQLKVDSQFERVFRKAIEELIEQQLLKETQQDSGIYEITPICDVLIPGDMLVAIEGKIKAYFSRFGKSWSEVKKSESFDLEEDHVG